MKECPTCGTTYPNDSRFCRSCGTELLLLDGSAEERVVAQASAALAVAGAGGAGFMVLTHALGLSLTLWHTPHLPMLAVLGLLAVASGGVGVGWAYWGLVGDCRFSYFAAGVWALYFLATVAFAAAQFLGVHEASSLLFPVWYYGMPVALGATAAAALRLRNRKVGDSGLMVGVAVLTTLAAILRLAAPLSVAWVSGPGVFVAYRTASVLAFALLCSSLARSAHNRQRSLDLS